MHKLTTKRQVTLPQAVCNAMDLQPGDYVEVFARDGVVHIVKLNSGNLAGKFNFKNEKMLGALPVVTILKKT